MTRACELCGKGAMIVLRRSHSNIASRTKQSVNLQYHIVGGVRMRMCSGCWKRQRAVVTKLKFNQ